MIEPPPAGSELDRNPVDRARSRHERAVANTLSWADRAACVGEYAEALDWLETLDAIAVPLPEPYLAKRAAWREACTARSELMAARRRLRLDEPTATRRMLELSQELETPGEVAVVLERALEGAMTLLGTDLGNIQLLAPEDGTLTIVTSCGFDSEFLEYFAVVADDSSACGRAAEQRAQMMIVDVEKDPGFAPHRQIAAASRFRAVQSSPIIDPTGRMHGVISTHFCDPRPLSASQMQLLAWYSERIGAALAYGPSLSLAHS